ncbi:MAG: exodeoxyribonuclease VII small subunit [Clostridia bacterium]|nr:exodeoxyribonuclease VII small subunit [Clostridia bacterium]
MTLEQNIKKLEQIASKISDEEVSLEESLKLFEQGVLVSEQTLSAIAACEGKITLLKERADALFEDEEDDG